MTPPSPTCRLCGGTPAVVFDLGGVPATDRFPLATTPIGRTEAGHPLAMGHCADCGLAQLIAEDAASAEPHGIEPRALRDQAAAAVATAATAGWLRGATVREFPSPHGGSWLPVLTAHGLRAVDDVADVVVDSFGIMHEPDQAAAFAARAAATAPAGVLLLQYHSLAAIVAGEQWNALRHQHFAYYSLASLRCALARAEMSVAAAWTFGLYGGTVVIAAVHGHRAAEIGVQRIEAAEAPLCAPAALRTLAPAMRRQLDELVTMLEYQAAQGNRIYGYGAASRAVATFALAGVHRGLVAAVADAAPGKHGRRMPGTDIPIVSPQRLRAARPDGVLLTVPDLLPELRTQIPELAGRWIVPAKYGNPFHPRSFDRARWSSRSVRS